MVQYYRIAGLVAEMDTFGRAADFARPYMIDFEGEPDLKVTSDWTQWQERVPNLSDSSYEYLATGWSFNSQLPNFDGLMLHSSALVMDGKAYLFSAPCGTGKSTHVSLWRRVFGDDRVRVLNDDKPVLRLEDGVWYAYGTPWSGKTGQNLNIRAPLGGIAMIERGETNELVPFTGSEAIVAVMSQIAKANDAATRVKMMEMLDKLMTMVPVWKLRCNMNPEAAVVAFETMSGMKKEN